MKRVSSPYRWNWMSPEESRKRKLSKAVAIPGWTMLQLRLLKPGTADLLRAMDSLFAQLLCSLLILLFKESN
ncbi:hypothetical protein NSMM_470015 [Nitrosomonas mobilis]|uniref:Uncharacterized protein n=1 Tax=Nitrosomonas mobilis TaxID=51642 RepID=A0A1G5SFH2_9PROT|nr:hypothetical protein NSMM_470015 [Nitrosomonas mobilis]